MPDDNSHMDPDTNTDRRRSRGDCLRDTPFVLLLLVIGLLPSWATLKYGWFGITPVAPEPNTAPSSMSAHR